MKEVRKVRNNSYLLNTPEGRLFNSKMTPFYFSQCYLRIKWYSLEADVRLRTSKSANTSWSSHYIMLSKAQKLCLSACLITLLWKAETESFKWESPGSWLREAECGVTEWRQLSYQTYFLTILFGPHVELHMDVYVKIGGTLFGVEKLYSGKQKEILQYSYFL